MTIGDPQSFNRYSYVGNDPVNLIDPTGLMCYARFEVWSVNGRESWTFLGVWCEPNDNTPASPATSFNHELGNGLLNPQSEPPRQRERREWRKLFKKWDEEYINCMRSADAKYERRQAAIFNFGHYFKDAVGAAIGGIVTESIKNSPRAALNMRFAAAFAIGITVRNIYVDFIENQSSISDRNAEQQQCRDTYNRHLGRGTTTNPRDYRKYPKW
jgi:hypothetical protein